MLDPNASLFPTPEDLSPTQVLGYFFQVSGMPIDELVPWSQGFCVALALTLKEPGLAKVIQEDMYKITVHMKTESGMAMNDADERLADALIDLCDKTGITYEKKQ